MAIIQLLNGQSSYRNSGFWYPSSVNRSVNCFFCISVKNYIAVYDSNPVTRPYGEVIFIENHRQERVQSQALLDGKTVPFTIEANAVLPLVRHVDVGNSFSIVTPTGQTTGFDTDKAVIYHEKGQRSFLKLQLNRKAKVHCPMPNRFEISENDLVTFRLFHGSQPQTVQLSFEDGTSFTIEVVSRKSLEKAVPHLEKSSAIHPLQWEKADEKLCFLSGNVKEADKPLDFSSFGQFSGYLGYESEFYAEETKETTIVFTRIEDPVLVFCNDQYVGKLSMIGAAAIELPVKKGKIH